MNSLVYVAVRPKDWQMHYQVAMSPKRVGIINPATNAHPGLGLGAWMPPCIH